MENFTDHVTLFPRRRIWTPEVGLESPDDPSPMEYSLGRREAHAVAILKRRDGGSAIPRVIGKG